MHHGGQHPVARRARVAFVALALLPWLLSCSSTESQRPSVDIGTAPRDAVREGGTLRWAVGDVPATLNVFQADADQDTTRVTGAVLPALFTLDEHGRPRRNADYLVSAEVTERRPRQVVVYQINPEAVWTDGKPLTADDFAAQWKALSGSDPAYWPARNDGYRKIGKVTRGSDPREVRVTFTEPYADWRSLFTPLYPQSATGSPEAFNDHTRTRLDATAGPFALGTTDRVGEDRSVTLSRNPHWWGKRAKLARILFVPVPPHKRAAALEKRHVDVAELEPQRPAAGMEKGKTDTVAGVIVIPGVNVRKATEAAFTQLTLNGASGPLTDERVRRAVARAIDRQDLAKAVLAPLGFPARTLDNHLVMGSQEGYQDNSAALGGPDRAAAASLLAEAGWRQTDEGTEPSRSGAAAPGQSAPGERNAAAPKTTHHREAKGNPWITVVAPDNPRVKDGRRLTLRLIVPHRATTLRVVAASIAPMLSAVGITTKIVEVGDESFFRDHVAGGEFDLALFSWPATAYPATDARPIYAKPEPAPDGSLTVEQNYARVGTDEIDQLFDQAAGELDPEAARTLTDRADVRIWAAAHSLPLFQRPQIVGVRTGLANVGAFGFLTPRYQDIGFTRN